MKSTRFIGTAADRNSGVYNLSEINEKIQDQTYPTNYEIENSCRFDATSGYLYRTPTNNNGSTYTFSVWIKRSGLSSLMNIISAKNSNTNSSNLSITSSDTLVTDKPGVNLHTLPNVLRDTGSWYHIVINYNNTASSIYINGVGSTGSAITYGNINTNVLHRIGVASNTTANYFNGYMADVHFIDGQALDPTHFAHSHPSTGRWSPKRYQGTYGTNGFHLEFKNDGTHTGVGGIGEDTSGNGNHWDVLGMTAHPICLLYTSPSPRDRG